MDGAAAASFVCLGVSGLIEVGCAPSDAPNKARAIGSERRLIIYLAEKAAKTLLARVGGRTAICARRAASAMYSAAILRMLEGRSSPTLE